MILVKPMKDYSQSIRTQAALVFVDAYYDDLSRITKDKDKLLTVFRKAMNQEVFYIAETNGEIAGILACSTDHNRGLILDKNAFTNEFGLIKGTIAYNALKKDFNRQLSYPPNTGYIECVGTQRKFRGKGIASALINYVTSELPFDRYVLEVADTNENAYRLYEKLGFRVFDKKKVKWAKLIGFNETIFMECHTTSFHIYQ